MEQITLIFDSLSVAFYYLIAYWWVYVPLLLYLEVTSLWKKYTKKKYLASLKWVLLEVTPPPEVIKSPKIAENLYLGLHAVYKGAIGWKDRFFGGKLQDWFSLEIIGTGGDMRFYIRTLESHRNLLEAQIFAQYPFAEVKIVPDYVEALPEKLPNDEYDLFGTELIFTKENAYPIRTYSDFEDPGASAKDASGNEEPKRIDPLAPLAEIFGLILPGEHIWLQLLIRPTGGDWIKEEGQPVLDKLMGKATKKEKSVVIKFMDFVDSLVVGPKEKKEEKKDAPQLSGAQREAVAKIEQKLGKLAFKSGYRLIYVARKDIFNRSRISAVTAMFKQLYTSNLNTFKPNPAVTPSVKGFLHQIFPSDKGFFTAEKEFKRKQDVYEAYRNRAFVEKPVILNVEELATLYHLPGTNVKAPALPRVDAKKGQPPITLPTR